MKMMPVNQHILKEYFDKCFGKLNCELEGETKKICKIDYFKEQFKAIQDAINMRKDDDVIFILQKMIKDVQEKRI